MLLKPKNEVYEHPEAERSKAEPFKPLYQTNRIHWDVPLELTVLNRDYTRGGTRISIKDC